MYGISDVHCAAIGIRQIELDVSQDPNGGLFGTAAALKLAGGNGTLPDPQYLQPGWKVHTYIDPCSFP